MLRALILLYIVIKILVHYLNFAGSFSIRSLCLSGRDSWKNELAVCLTTWSSVYIFYFSSQTYCQGAIDGQLAKVYTHKRVYYSKHKTKV